MKKELNSLFLFLFLFFISSTPVCAGVSVVYDFFGEGPCGSCEDVDPGTVLYGKTIRLANGVNCQAVAQDYVDAIKDSMGAIKEDCSYCADWYAESCTEFGLMVCCDPLVLADVNKRMDVVIGRIQVDEIPFGQEASAAEDTFNTWSSENPTPDPPSGFQTTDRLDGYSYTVGVGENNTSIIDETAWKRAGYGREGTINTLEDIQGGVVGSGIDYNQLADSVQTGIEGAIGSGEGSDSYSSSDQSLNEKDSVSGEYSESVERDSITDKITDFLSDNPILDIFEDTEVTATPGASSFSANVFDKDIVFDFAPFSDFFSLMGTFILSIASIYSIFIALGRG